MPTTDITKAIADRPYFPADPAAQYQWAGHYLQALAKYDNLLPGVNWPLIRQLRAAYELLGATDDYLTNAQALAAQREADFTAAMWGRPGQPHHITPGNAFTGPISLRTVDGGLYPLIFASLDNFIDDPACTDEIKNALGLQPPVAATVSA
ncbi:MAG: hypothetical protein LBK60_05660 [Verrucomicrobiales bacterium]|jgi:hypothetical protein|nr:hypothetical protein [Verrucomicrobiales bacterium]